jgi:acetamidase/formamidase
MPLKSMLGFFLAAAASPLFAQTDRPSSTAEPLTGHWVVASDVHGTPIYVPMDLAQRGEKISGTYDGQKLEGSFKGGALHFEAKDDSGGQIVDGTLVDGALSGKIVDYDNANKEHPDRYTFTATLVRDRRPVVPRRHELVPSAFYREFSALNKPILTVASGDTIHTSTIDAGGADETGQRRSAGGNPQTGPFYVESAMPGDTLSVHLIRLRLNRDYAVSDDAIVPRGLNSALAAKMQGGGKTVRWHLDLTQGLASPERAGEHTTQYRIPVHPMLGCIATAPSAARAAPSSGDSGSFGGNMDFNEVVEGATIYLPVFVPGALLYVGDGHAIQGDGELNGNALETSLDVEFTVNVIPRRRTPAPRIESTTHIMAMGLGGSLDDAFREATSNMAQWLVEDYKLTPSEIAEVIGPAAEYKVSEVADRNAGIVLKIPKVLLQKMR